MITPRLQPRRSQANSHWPCNRESGQFCFDFHYPTKTMPSFFRFVERHPGRYMAFMVCVGLGLRLWMAHGQIDLFLDPSYPLLRD